MRLFLFIALIFACATELPAQFRVDRLSGHCYVRTGEGNQRYVDTTAVRKLAIYTSQDLRRSDLKRVTLRRGFARPAVYGQDPTDPKTQIELRAARETLMETYYVVRKPTTNKGHYEWEYFQESWTKQVGTIWNDKWERCNCAVADYSLQRVASILIREGDLPYDFEFSSQDDDSRHALVAGINSYAAAYGLTPLLEQQPLVVNVPFPILAAMGLRYAGGVGEIQPLARRLK